MENSNQISTEISNRMSTEISNPMSTEISNPTTLLLTYLPRYGAANPLAGVFFNLSHRHVFSWPTRLR